MTPNNLLSIPAEVRLLIYEILFSSETEKDEILIFNGKPSLIKEGHGRHIRPKSWSSLLAHPQIFIEAQRLVLATHPICFYHPVDIRALARTWCSQSLQGKAEIIWSGKAVLDLGNEDLVAEAILALKSLRKLTHFDVRVHQVDARYHSAFSVIFKESCPVHEFLDLQGIELKGSKAQGFDTTFSTARAARGEDMIDHLHKIDQALKDRANLKYADVAYALRLARYFWSLGVHLGQEAFFRQGLSRWIGFINRNLPEAIAHLKEKARRGECTCGAEKERDVNEADVLSGSSGRIRGGLRGPIALPPITRSVLDALRNS